MDVSDQEQAGTSQKAFTEEQNERNIPVIIVLGMAGAGKSTFVHQLTMNLCKTGQPYVINLDPACRTVPFPINIGNCNCVISGIILHTVLDIYFLH